jgi:hypothetical protein
LSHFSHLRFRSAWDCRIAIWISDPYQGILLNRSHLTEIFRVSLLNGMSTCMI